MSNYIARVWADGDLFDPDAANHLEQGVAAVQADSAAAIATNAEAIAANTVAVTGAQTDAEAAVAVATAEAQTRATAILAEAQARADAITAAILAQHTVDLGTYARQWQTATFYAAGTPVVNPSGTVATAKVDFTSGPTYDPTNWTLTVAPITEPVALAEVANRTAAITNLSNVFAPRVANTIAWMGDSITANGGIDANLTTLLSASNNCQGFWCWAMGLLGQRLKIVARVGVGGQTSAQMLARFGTDVIAHAPGWCHILAGTNDIAGIVPMATTKANLLAMIVQCQAAGIRVILGTVPPRAVYSGTMRADADTINDWIRGQGQTQPGLVVVDYAAALTDPVTSLPLATVLQADGVHPSSVGSYLMGVALATALAPLVPASNVLSCVEGDTLNLLSHGRFAAGGNGAVPTGWTPAGTAPTYAKVSRTDGVAGSWQQITVPVAGSTSLTSTNIAVGSTVAVGDTLQAFLEYSISGLDPVAAANTQAFWMKLQCWNGSWFARQNDLYWDTSYPNMPSASRSGVLATMPIIVPAGASQVQLAIAMTGGGTYNLDRATVRRVT